MAQVSITATQVLPSTSADIRTGTVGAATTVVAGSMVYAHTDGTLLLTDCDSLVGAAAVGMCLNGGSTGQVVRYVASDTALQMGTAAALTAGMTLYVDDLTPGGLLTTAAEVPSGAFTTTVGLVTAATLGYVNFKIVASGVAKA